MNIFDKSNRVDVPEYSCRNCGHHMDAFSSADASKSVPREDDVAICLYCSVVSVFNENLELLPMTPEDYLELNEADPETMNDLAKVVKMVQSGELYNKYIEEGVRRAAKRMSDESIEDANSA